MGKNGTAGTADRRIVAGATLSVDGIEYTLQIRDVEMSDQATYICQVILFKIKIYSTTGWVVTTCTSIQPSH